MDTRLAETWRAAWAPQPHGVEQLTARQQECLHWLSFGRSDCEIAAAMGISEDGVAHHLRKIYKAFNVHSRLEAVLHYRGYTDV